MTITIFLKLIGFVFLMACGQILFKYTAISMGQQNIIENIVKLFLTPFFLLAIVLYAIATLLWVHILQTVPLGIGYSFMALGFVLVPLADWFLFAQRYPTLYLIGVLLIVGGIIVIGFSSKI